MHWASGRAVPPPSQAETAKKDGAEPLEEVLAVSDSAFSAAHPGGYKARSTSISPASKILTSFSNLNICS